VDAEYQDDVFTLDMAAYGVAEDLWPYMSQAQKDDMTDIQLQYKNIWGGMYRVSWWQGMSYTYYNKKLFKEAGLAVPTTWDQFLSTAVKMTRDTTGGGEINQFGYVATGEEGAFAHSWWEFLYQAGGEEWKLAPGGKVDPKAKQAFEFMKNVFAKAAPKDQPAIQYNQSRAYILEGKAAMQRDWADTGNMAIQANKLDEVGVMNFPAGPAGPYGIAHGWGVVVNKYGDNFKKNKQAVIDFVLFMMRPDVHQITASAELPAFKSTYADAAFMAKLYKTNPMSQVAGGWWKWRKTRQFPPRHGAEYMNGQGKLAIQGTFGGATVDKTLQDMQNLIDSLKD
jgi:ABC-type glycerol-3-phosphate transport system substrate-binding protein